MLLTLSIKLKEPVFTGLVIELAESKSDKLSLYFTEQFLMLSIEAKHWITISQFSVVSVKFKSDEILLSVMSSKDYRSNEPAI